MYSVAIYLVDKVYGGPEEGGWYYTAGEPVDDLCQYTKGFDTHKEAVTYSRTLNDVIAKLNAGRPSISSVLSQGRYSVEVFEGNPMPFPVERPYYA